MINKKQKRKLDTCFNHSAVSQMTESEFVKTYTGKMPMQIDIHDAMKYLNVKPDKKTTYTSTPTTKKDKSEK